MNRKSIAIIGAGPKAAAIACKAAALLDGSEYSDRCPRIVVFEAKGRAGANWSGVGGDSDKPAVSGHKEFTDGLGRLVTRPEKDMGFPYSSPYGPLINREMLKYSWLAYNSDPNQGSGALRYANWIDLGQNPPTHNVWADYVQWALEKAERKGTIDIKFNSEIDEIEVIDQGRVRLHWNAPNKAYSGEISNRDFAEFDGVVVTGPGLAKELHPRADIPTRVRECIPNAKTFWAHKKSILEDANKPGAFSIAVVGRGEAAAAIVNALLGGIGNRGDSETDVTGKTVTIINSAGVLFTRGTSLYETRYFSNPSGWAMTKADSGLPLEVRRDIIRRADRGVFSPEMIASISADLRVRNRAGEVTSVTMESINGRPKFTVAIAPDERARKAGASESRRHSFDMVVGALGFDHGAFLEGLKVFPTTDDRAPTDANTRTLDRSAPWRSEEARIDKYLRLDVKCRNGASIHVPMLAGVGQGPGFPTLTCLGVLSDRILDLYATSPEAQISGKGPSSVFS